MTHSRNFLYLLLGYFIGFSFFSTAIAEVSVDGDLPRRAAFGFEVKAENSQLIVSGVVEGSAAAEAGLKVGDVISAFNGQNYSQDFEGEDLLRRLDGGQQVRLGVERDGTRHMISFTPPAVPFDDPEGVTTLYNGLMTTDGAHLRTALSYREDLVGPLPVVMLIQWVSCGIVTDDMEVELQTVMDALPVAIFRVERSADGDSEGPACHELDYDSEIAHYTEAALAIADSQLIDPSKIYLYGSSLGSTVAPLVAQRLKEQGLQVAGLMVQGGGAVTYVERMINFDRQYLERREGRVFADIHEEMNSRILFQTEYLIKNRHPDDIAKDSAEMARVRENTLGLGQYNHYGRPFSWHQQAAKHDFLQAWLDTGAPGLIMFTEYDQFEARHGHRMIAEVMNRVSPGIAEYVELEGLNHFNDLHTDIDQAYFRAVGTPAIDRLAGHMVRWLSSQLAD